MKKSLILVGLALLSAPTLFCKTFSSTDRTNFYKKSAALVKAKDTKGMESLLADILKNYAEEVNNPRSVAQDIYQSFKTPLKLSEKTLADYAAIKVPSKAPQPAPEEEAAPQPAPEEEAAPEKEPQREPQREPQAERAATTIDSEISAELAGENRKEKLEALIAECKALKKTKCTEAKVAEAEAMVAVL